MILVLLDGAMAANYSLSLNTLQEVVAPLNLTSEIAGYSYFQNEDSDPSAAILNGACRVNFNYMNETGETIFNYFLVESNLQDKPIEEQALTIAESTAVGSLKNGDFLYVLTFKGELLEVDLVREENKVKTLLTISRKFFKSELLAMEDQKILIVDSHDFQVIVVDVRAKRYYSLKANALETNSTVAIADAEYSRGTLYLAAGTKVYILKLVESTKDNVTSYAMPNRDVINLENSQLLGISLRRLDNMELLFVLERNTGLRVIQINENKMVVNASNYVVYGYFDTFTISDVVVDGKVTLVLNEVGELHQGICFRLTVSQLLHSSASYNAARLLPAFDYAKIFDKHLYINHLYYSYIYYNYLYDSNEAMVTPGYSFPYFEIEDVFFYFLSSNVAGTLGYNVFVVLSLNSLMVYKYEVRSPTLTCSSAVPLQVEGGILQLCTVGNASKVTCEDNILNVRIYEGVKYTPGYYITAMLTLLWVAAVIFLLSLLLIKRKREKIFGDIKNLVNRATQMKEVNKKKYEELKEVE